MPSASIAIGTAEEGRDGVDDERDVGIFRERAANLRQRIHHAGRGFVMNQSDGVESARSPAARSTAF